MPNACGKLVQSLRILGSKKCVHLSTVSMQFTTKATSQWINTHIYTQAYTAFTYPQSTSKFHPPAPVGPLLIHTFHSTYNNRHQYI